MRVQFNYGSKSIDLEEDVAYTWEEKEKFLDLVSDALFAIGFSEKDLLETLERKQED